MSNCLTFRAKHSRTEQTEIQHCVLVGCGIYYNRDVHCVTYSTIRSYLLGLTANNFLFV